MTMEEKRKRVSDEYPGRSWKARVSMMPDRQIIAIYHNILRRVHPPKPKKKKYEEVGYQFQIKDYM